MATGKMTLFDKAILNQDDGKKPCLMCNNKFKPDKRNVNRGWGFFCSKKCAARYKKNYRSMNSGEKKKADRTKKLRQLGIF